MARHSRVPGALVAGAVVLAGAAGLFLRLWYFFHQSLGADDATVGLMARQALHGHFSAFFWAQDYGGAESYVVAIGFRLFGSSAWVLKATPIALFALATLLTYRVARRLTGSRLASSVAAGLVWVWPEAVVWDSTRELGFRNLTLCCGLGCLLLALGQAQDAGQGSARGGALRLGAVGLLAGVGWWSSPEVVYFLVPAGLVLAGSALRRREPLRRWAAQLVVLATGAGLGAMVWIWGSVNNGFGSLDLSTNSGGPPSSYLGRLGIFFRESLPLLFGLRLPVMVGWRRTADVAWIVPRPIGVLAYALALLGVAVALGLAWRRRATVRAVAVSVVAFPFLYCVSASTSGGTDGRFGIYLIPLLALLLVAASGGRPRPRPEARHMRRGDQDRWRPVVLASLVALGVGTSLASFVEIEGGAGVVPGPFSRWGDPNAPLVTAVDKLRSLGITVVVADYWEAGDLAFVGGGRPATVSVDLVRDGAANRAALHTAAHHAMALLCYPPDAVGRSTFVFGSATEGPGGLGEQSLEQRLTRMGVGYTVHLLGVLDAVVPDRFVGPQELGIPAWLSTLPPATSWTAWTSEHTPSSS